MSYQLYPSDLTDTQWDYSKPVTPAAKPRNDPETDDAGPQLGLYFEPTGDSVRRSVSWLTVNGAPITHTT